MIVYINNDKAITVLLFLEIKYDKIQDNRTKCGHKTLLSSYLSIRNKNVFCIHNIIV